MIAAAIVGGVFGVAVLTGWRALAPAAPPLEVALARLARTPAPSASTTGLAAWKLAAGRAGRTLLAALGVDVNAAYGADLAVLDRPVDQHVVDKVVAGVTGALLPVAWAGITSVGFGFTIPPSPIVVSAFAFAVVGFLLPDLTLRGEARRKRRDFRLALGSFLNLVVVNLAGGSGVEAALADAADVGRSWAFAYLRQALSAARLTGESPWDALGSLGQRIGIDDLVELAATISLAGTEGSKVRESLVAKAAAMRDRALAEAEARAQSATERMAVPTVMLMAGFILLVGYPAVRAVMTGL